MNNASVFHVYPGVNVKYKVGDSEYPLQVC